MPVSKSEKGGVERDEKLSRQLRDARLLSPCGGTRRERTGDDSVRLRIGRVAELNLDTGRRSRRVSKLVSLAVGRISPTRRGEGRGGGGGRWTDDPSVVVRVCPQKVADDVDVSFGHLLRTIIGSSGCGQQASLGEPNGWVCGARLGHGRARAHPDLPPPPLLVHSSLDWSHRVPCP